MHCVWEDRGVCEHVCVFTKQKHRIFHTDRIPGSNVAAPLAYSYASIVNRFAAIRFETQDMHEHDADAGVTNAASS